MVSRRGPRPENEDFGAYRATADEGCVACVADGVGGRQGGAYASKLSVEFFLRHAVESNDLGGLLLKIDQELREAGEVNAAYAGMSTTFTGCVIRNLEMRWVHAGDSRLSILRGNGIRQLTVDDTEVNRLYKAGKLTDEEAAGYFRRNVLENAVGGRSPPVPRFGTFEVKMGDRLVFTTDGTHKSVSKREIRDISLGTKSALEFCERIAGLAEERGTKDNLTVLAVFVVDTVHD